MIKAYHERLMKLAGLVHTEGLDAATVDVLNIENRLLSRMSNTSFPEEGSNRSAFYRVIALLLENHGSLTATPRTDV